MRAPASVSCFAAGLMCAIAQAAAADRGLETPVLTLVRLYEFNDNLDDSLGSGEALVEDNTASSSFDSGVWSWTADVQPGGGLVFDTASTSLAAHYSIGIRFRFDQVSGYRKIIDFKNHTSDRGFYFLSGQLDFYPQPVAPSSFAAGTVVEFVLCRDSVTDTVTVYMIAGGLLTKEYEFTDSAEDAVATTVDGRVRFRFFQDDNIATGEWARGGAVENVRIWNGPLAGGPFVSAGGALDTLPGSAATAIDSAIVVGHLSGSNIQSGSVTISSGGCSGDVLAASTSGTSISASYDPDSYVLTLDGTDTPANYQQVMRTVSFTSAASAAGGTRVITYAVSDGVLSAEDTATVTLPITAPSVTTAVISAIEDTTATCGGEVTAAGGAGVTARGVCWSTLPGPTTANSKTTDGAGEGAFTSSLSGLAAATEYYVRAYAINAVGTSYGEQRTFTTNEPPAPDVRVTIAADADDVEVGDEIAFQVVVQNVGSGDATDVLLRFPLPPGTTFVGAWLVGYESGLATPLNAHVEGNEIVVELGDVAAAEGLTLDIVLAATTAGAVTLEAEVSSAEQGAPATARANTEVGISDVYWEVVETMAPVHACGWLGLTPALLLAGLAEMKRRGMRS